MSDYATSLLESELPLFAATAIEAKQFHERECLQQEALELLRAGVELTDVYWKRQHPGSRIAPTIEKLRNAHGFEIGGNGSVKSPHYLADRMQMFDSWLLPSGVTA